MLLTDGGSWSDIRTQLAEHIDEQWGGVQEGGNDKKYAAAVQRRAELVLRQNTFQAYAVARYKDQQDVKAAFPYLMYLTCGDENVRDEHAELDGKILPIDDPFWVTHYPPWDFGCRCLVESISEEEAKELGVWDGAEKWEKNTPTRADKDYAFRPDTLTLPMDEISRDREPEDLDLFTAQMEKAGVLEIIKMEKTGVPEVKEETQVFKPATTIDEAKRYMLDKITDKINFDVNKLPGGLDMLNKVNEYVGNNLKKFGLGKFPELSTLKSEKYIAQVTVDYTGKTRVFAFSPSAWADPNKIFRNNVESFQKAGDIRYLAIKKPEGVLQHVVDHEFGHVIFDASKTVDKKAMLTDTFERAKQSKDIRKISKYGAKNRDEFFAETFAMHQRGAVLPDYVVKTIEEVMKKMIYQIPVEWYKHIITTTDKDGNETDTVDTSTTPAEILKEMKELDAEVYANAKYHAFQFVDGAKS